MSSSHFLMLDWWKAGLKLVMPARINVGFFSYMARIKSLKQLKGICVKDTGLSDVCLSHP